VWFGAIWISYGWQATQLLVNLLPLHELIAGFCAALKEIMSPMRKTFYSVSEISILMLRGTRCRREVALST
jgi:hypothetical protein